MKKWVCLVLAVLLLAGCCAMAEEKVQLPDSRFFITLPDGMEYDGPGQLDGDAFAFAYAGKSLGLDISFLSYDAKGTELISLLQGVMEKSEEAALYQIAGQEMIVYRTTDPTDGARMIGYILKDGDHLVEIIFTYANQAAADMTEQIIQSLTE